MLGLTVGLVADVTGPGVVGNPDDEQLAGLSIT